MLTVTAGRDGEQPAMLTIFFVTYGAVFLAEIIGDKLLYTTGVLAARYRTAPVLFGMALAFSLKVGVAVLVGGAVSRLPRPLLAGVTAASFLGVAFALWRRPAESEGSPREHTARKAALVSFAVIFLSEWGDVGQITAATMSARFGLPLVVWAGAVSAMVTKGALAASVGAGVRGWVRRHVPARAVRYCGVGLMLVLGLLSAWEMMRAEAPDRAGWSPPPAPARSEFFSRR